MLKLPIISGKKLVAALEKVGFAEVRQRGSHISMEKVHSKPRSSYMKIDLDELNKDKENNFKERLEFIDRYVEWLKSTPNKVWSKQHKEFINSAYQNRNIQK